MNDLQKFEGINGIVEEDRLFLFEKFREEVLAEVRYSNPLMKPKQVELLTGWRFNEYVKSN